MKCLCPKCAANIELVLDVSTVTESGTHGKCPQCSAKFPISREDFAVRAVRKAEELSCASCGSPLGHSTYCPGCGRLFPDFLAVGARVRRKRAKSKGVSVPVSFTSGPKTEKPARAASERTDRTSAKSRVVAILIFVVLAAVAAVVGNNLYERNKAEQVFALRYAAALAGIKFGTDLSLQTCTKIATEWKARQDAGQAYEPRSTADDQAGLGGAKADTDKLMAKLSVAPQKFVTAKDKLSKLYDVYAKANSLALTPSGSLSSYIDAAAKVDSEFKSRAQELKTDLPPKLAEELKKAKGKFRSLESF